MLIRKAVISVAIFGILFLGAAILHVQTKRDHIEFGIKKEKEILRQLSDPSLNVEAETLPETWKFGSREYIKIQNR